MEPFEVVGLEDGFGVGFDVHFYAGPVGMDVAVLFDEDVVQDVVGDAGCGVGFDDCGVGQRFVVREFHAFVVEMEAAAHPAAVEARVAGDVFEVVEDFVVFFVVEVFRCRGGVVVAELDRRAFNFAESLKVRDQFVNGVVFVQDAVDAKRHGKAGEQVVVGFDDVVLHVSRDVDACDFVLVFFGELEDVVLGLELGDGQGGVDINFVRGGDVVEHDLQRIEVGDRLTARENEVAHGRDGVHPVDAAADFFGRKSRQVGVFFFIDAEGAVVFAVVRDEYRDCRAAFAGFVRVGHDHRASLVRREF